jgi:hypothetical protein
MRLIVKKSIFAGILTVGLLAGCKQSLINTEKAKRPGIPVTVTHIRPGQMVSSMELSATSVFLYKAVVKAPVTGYIESMHVNPGDKVSKDQVLFTIMTKEAIALMEDTLSDLNFSGIVKVKTATTGLISSIEHPKGDFITEGDQLCQVVVPESFVFILDIPFELSGLAKLNTVVEITLPDGRIMKGTIKSRFPSMTGSSQTERFIVQADKSISLPENLVVKIRIIKETINNAVSLLKSCILTDETMQSFWVMKLINDSTAIKVLVNTGITEEKYVQITDPEFNENDLFLSSGNYGLGDSAYVKVLQILKP